MKQPLLLLLVFNIQCHYMLIDNTIKEMTTLIKLQY